MITANAYPRKNFFAQMFTKDISLEDCVLDLIDNSIDGLIKSRGLRLSKIANEIWIKKQEKVRTSDLPTIRVKISDTGFEIKDNCGGIDLNDAVKEVFNFGHALGYKSESLGVYGIGLKRALFKLGDYFEISSQTKKNGFHCELDVRKWVERDDGPQDWTIPLEERKAAPSLDESGTTIRVTRLHDEVKMRIRAGVDTALRSSISKTFCFFLDRHVRIFVNDHKVEPSPIPASKPANGSISFDRFSDDGVEIRILATIAAQDEAGQYDQSKAGWYIVCNGRAVLSADKSDLTGWAVAPNPSFQPKHRGFVGIVFFESTNALLLPWTTTKRSLNRESGIYIRTRNRMTVAAKPVFSFINSKYPSDAEVTPVERAIARQTVSTTFADLASPGTAVFAIPRPPVIIKLTTKVQFDAKDTDLAKIRKHLRSSNMSAGRIGEHTFNYFLKQEGLA